MTPELVKSIGEGSIPDRSMSGFLGDIFTSLVPTATQGSAHRPRSLWNVHVLMEAQDLRATQVVGSLLRAGWPEPAHRQRKGRQEGPRGSDQELYHRP